MSADRAHRWTPGGVSSANRRSSSLDEHVITAARGAHLWTAAGSRLIDMHGGSGPVVLGHANLAVDSAARDAASRLGLPGVVRTDIEVELAETLVESIPSFDSVLFCSSGSEATYHAIRLARAVTGRRKLLKVEGGYHGWHDSVAVGFLKGDLTPMSAGALDDVVKQTITVPFNDRDGLLGYMNEWGGETAAFILEPIMHNIGVILPDPGYLELVRSECSRWGIVLIFDEVVSGVRHGVGGFQEISGVTPDLSVFGKALANGYPIAALGGRGDLMDNFSTGGGTVLFLGTYNGHPGSVAAALTTVAIRKDPQSTLHLEKMGESLAIGWRDLIGQFDLPWTVVRFGSIVALYASHKPPNNQSEALDSSPEVVAACRESMARYGVFENARPLARSCVSLAHTESDIERVLEAAEMSLKEPLNIWMEL
ncbi:MAG: aspartate aminotransferase family protein [Acidimicrobiia bacterium]